jgi:hypothetical protein
MARIIAGKGRTAKGGRQFWLPFFFLIIAVSFHGCATISLYSETAYQQATSLKVDSLAIMAKATDPYAQHQEEVKALRLKIDKAYEYAKGRPKNEDSTRQWEILKSPDRHLLGGFLERWRKDSTLSLAYLEEKKLQVGAAFDTISGLESGKIKPSELK